MTKRPPSKKELVILLFCVFLISFAALTFEITLTRIFSVTFSYHYTFLAVSLALLGLGLGGIIARSFSYRGILEKIFIGLTVVSLVFSFSVSLLTIVVATTPYQNPIVNAGLMFIPFFIAGIFLATVYSVFAVYGSSVYFVDLAGAAVGALAVSVLLSLYGAINTVLLLGAITSMAAVFLAAASKRRRIVLFATMGLLVLSFSTQYFNTNQVLEVQIADGQYKELYDALKEPSLGAKIVESRWSAFGRTDLVEFEGTPNMKVIYVDANAGTKMYRFDGNFSNTSSEVDQLRYSTAYYPYYFAKKDEALIIGPGGGVDVLTALMADVNHITAVEVNPETVNIVRDYSDYNGGIYTKYDNVHVVVDEGRSFLKRTSTKYDIIMLNIPVTKTAQGISGYSLAENYLFTTDSFKDYLNSLKDQGYLAIVAHNRLEAYKLAAITLKVFDERGTSARESMHYMIVTELPHSHFPVFILKKSAFTLEETENMYTKSFELGLTPVYFPYVNSENLDQILAGLANGDLSLDAVISYLREYYGIDMEPPTDDRPFFYKFESELPPILPQVLTGAVLLCATVLIMWFFSFRYRRLRPTQGESHLLAHRFSLFTPYYFFALGGGFMLIEVSLIQKFILFLGHPTTAVSVTLFSLLLSSGIGSLYSKRWKAESLHPALRASLVVGILVFIYMILLPSLFNMFLMYETMIRFFIAIILLFPLGFFMGAPFSIGVRFLEKGSKEDIPWMWSLNGASSLLGSVSATTSAFLFGFNSTLLLGGVSYLTISLFGYFKTEKRQETIITEKKEKYETKRGKQQKKIRTKGSVKFTFIQPSHQ